LPGQPEYTGSVAATWCAKSAIPVVNLHKVHSSGVLSWRPNCSTISSERALGGEGATCSEGKAGTGREGVTAGWPGKITLTDQATAQGNRSIAVGRDVIKSIINTGNHNQFFIGDYERLRDAYIEPWSVFERVNLKDFVGREWLLAQVDAFLRDHDRGYFILEAEAGLGKTTFLAWVTRERGYVHHFTELAPGLDGIGRSLKNLAAQLVLAFQLSPYEAEGVLPGAAARPDYLLRLLKQAADQRHHGEKIVLVVDALDEAGTPQRQNVLGLPEVLPEGVFIIVSQRPVSVTLHVDSATTPRRRFHLVADSGENQEDLRRFLELATTWPGITQALRDSNYKPEQFATILLQKCDGVWIYLHYVIHEIDRGERSPLDLHALPDGMVHYYARYWQGWRDEDEEKWYEIYLPLLTTLAAAQEPVTVELLVGWADVKISAQQLRRLLNERWGPFLAITGQGRQTRYRFYHATLREFFDGEVEPVELTVAEEAMVNELGTATREAHNRLAESYLTAWGGLEECLPGLQEAALREIGEGYGLRHLAGHLEASGRIDDLHRLLALETSKRRNAWYQTKEASGDLAGYVADVTRAWRLAEEACDPSGSTHAGREIGLQNRYALITASLNGLSANIPPELMAALVEKGIWTPSQGLVYAQQVPDPAQRADALATLAFHLPEPLKGEALQAVLAAARVIEDWDDQAEILVALASRLKELECHEEALATARAIGIERYRVKVLASLVPDLPQAFLQQALATAQTIEFEEYRAEALATLACHLPQPLLQEALQVAGTIWFEEHRIRALAALAPHLPESMKAAAMQKALSMARTTWDEYSRGQALAALGPHLSEPVKGEVLQEALAAAWKSPETQSLGDSPRAEILTALAPHLPEPLLQGALEAAWKTRDGEARVQALTGLIPHLPQSLFGEALAAARTIEDESSRARALVALTPYLPESLLSDALEAARTIKGEDNQARVLIGLAPHLPESLWEEALAAARAGDGYRPKVLIALAPYLPGPLLNEALAMARATWPRWWRAEALAALATSALSLPKSLTEELLGEALQAARASGDGGKYQVRALIAVARYLSEPVKEETLREAVDATRSIWHEPDQVESLVHLAPLLPRSLLQEAFEAALKIGNRKYRTQALAGLAPHLPQPLLREALEVAQVIGDEDDFANVLTSLAPHLPLPLLQEALEAAQTLLAPAWTPQGRRRRVEALAALAPYLPQSLLRETLDAARAVRDDGLRSEQLAALAGHLPQPLRGEVLQEVLAAAKELVETDVPGEDVRAKVLLALAPHLSEPLLREVLDTAGAMQFLQNRPKVLSAVAVRLVELDCLQDALEMARGIGDNGHRAETLLTLARDLPEALRDEALQGALKAARAIRSEWDRAEILSALVPNLSQPVREEVLQQMMAAERAHVDVENWAKALFPVASYLPEPVREEVLQEGLTKARAIWNEEYRAKVLSTLAPYLSQPLKEEALEESLEIIRTIELGSGWNRSWLLTPLARHLAQLPMAILYLLWRETSHILAARTRRQLLADIRALEPVIAALGGSEAVAESAQAMLDVRRWWP